MRIVVGIGVGSGYDINARALARHLGKHIPGNPTVIVQNQPGAGSLTMVNQLFRNGPVRRHRRSAPRSTACRRRRCCSPMACASIRSKIIWIGSTNRETQVTYVWHTAP